MRKALTFTNHVAQCIIGTTVNQDYLNKQPVQNLAYKYVHKNASSNDDAIGSCLVIQVSRFPDLFGISTTQMMTSVKIYREIPIISVLLDIQEG